MNDLDYENRIKAVMEIDDAPHFTERVYAEAVGGMVNEDGTKGAHFDLDQVKELIKAHKIDLGENNVFDFAYCVNMVYSDYHGSIPDNDKSYVEVAKAFLFDEDGPKGKAVKYYLAMKY